MQNEKRVGDVPKTKESISLLLEDQTERLAFSFQGMEQGNFELESEVFKISSNETLENFGQGYEVADEPVYFSESVDEFDDQEGQNGSEEEVEPEILTARSPIGAKNTSERVTKKSDVKNIPYRWICSLVSYFRDPDDPGRVVPLEGGTGLLIGANYVLTAAHTIYAEITGSKGTKKVQRALRTKVYPGRNGVLLFPFGRADSERYAYLEAYAKDQDPRWDYALIKLKQNIGLKKYRKLKGQPLGYWGSTKWGANTQIKALSTNYLKTQIVNVSGYPKGKRGKQYIAHDRVQSVPPTVGGKPINQLITYLVDTSEGQSGSPVWKYVKSSGKRYLIAVHHGGCSTKLDGCIKSGKVTSNMGVLITPTVIAQIRKWIKTM